MLPKRIPKQSKRATRWRSQAHCNWLRGFHCCIAGCSSVPIEVAHVRLGSGAGIGQKPDDFRAVPLCRDHHSEQHQIGEMTFWSGRSIEGLIDQFNAASPKAAEINRVKRERREHGAG